MCCDAVSVSLFPSFAECFATSVQSHETDQAVVLLACRDAIDTFDPIISTCLWTLRVVEPSHNVCTADQPLQ